MSESRREASMSIDDIALLDCGLAKLNTTDCDEIEGLLFDAWDTLVHDRVF
jgi:hypothetical protein